MDMMTENDEKEQSLYEVGYHLDPNMAEEMLPAEAGKVQEAIESNGGVITLADSPKLRELAYPILKSLGGKRQKYSKGYFGWTKFNVSADAISNIRAALTGQSTIIRFMITHATTKTGTSYVRRVMRKTDKETPVAPMDKEAVAAEIDKEVDSLIASATPVSATQ